MNLYKWEIDTGYGLLNCLFVATEKEKEELVGKKFSSYEDVGKYSEFEIIIEDDEFELILDNVDLNNKIIMGIDIFNRVLEYEE